MNTTKQRLPGDLILDRYMPDATPEQREDAHANLKAYVAVIMRLNQRLAREAGDKSVARLPRAT